MGQLEGRRPIEEAGIHGRSAHLAVAYHPVIPALFTRPEQFLSFLCHDCPLPVACLHLPVQYLGHRCLLSLVLSSLLTLD